MMKNAFITLYPCFFVAPPQGGAHTIVINGVMDPLEVAEHTWVTGVITPT